MSNTVKFIIAIAFLLGIGACIYFIGTGNLSTREGALLSIVLTIFAILATWIVTHIYSQSQYKKAIEEVQESYRTNLKTYALKAAEKVNNLSTQLSRLGAYLQESLDNEGSDRLPEELLSKQDKIESAILMINTLKSVNDTALSDWEGVIGDELDEQRELQAEREEELKKLIERLEEAISESKMDTRQFTEDSTQMLAKEIDSLRKELRLTTLSLGLPPLRRIKSVERVSRHVIESHCPECGEPIKYKQKKSPRSIKTVKCTVCKAELISRYDAEKEFVLEKRHIAKEQIACPTCHITLEVQLDTFPSSSLAVECNNCHTQLTVTRTIEGVTVKTQLIRAGAEVLTDDIVELVKNSLPPQPWPQGVHKSVADKLGLSNQIVAEAIQKLIRKGVFKPQIGGKLYVPESTVTKKKSQTRKTEEG